MYIFSKTWLIIYISVESRAAVQAAEAALKEQQTAAAVEKQQLVEQHAQQVQQVHDSHKQELHTQTVQQEEQTKQGVLSVHYNHGLGRGFKITGSKLLGTILPHY